MHVPSSNVLDGYVKWINYQHSHNNRNGEKMTQLRAMEPTLARYIQMRTIVRDWIFA